MTEKKRIADGWEIISELEHSNRHHDPNFNDYEYTYLARPAKPRERGSVYGGYEKRTYTEYLRRRKVNINPSTEENQ